jgi:hypothetical protein
MLRGVLLASEERSLRQARISDDSKERPTVAGKGHGHRRGKKPRAERG